MASLRISAITQPWAVRAAWCSWAAVMFVVSLIILAGNKVTVTGIYRAAAHAWCSGQDVYINTGGGFLYLPSSAVLFVPFAVLPLPLGDILWQLASIGTFAFGVRRIATLSGRTTGVEMFPLITLFALPPALSDARCGQATMIMNGMMMLATVDLFDRRWWRATLWLSLGFAFKPLALVMILLVAALERPMTWRLAVGITLVLLVPFVTQSPQYVLDQHVKCYEMSRAATHLGLESRWSQPFSALALAGFEVPEATQTMIRVGAAVVALGLCWQARRRNDGPRATVELFAISVIYILLFNPRTENCTYEMLGPVLGISAASAILVEHRRGAGAVLGVMMLAIFCGEEVCRLLWPSVTATWHKSLVCLGYLVFFFLPQLFERRLPRCRTVAALPFQVGSTPPHVHHEFSQAGP